MDNMKSQLDKSVRQGADRYNGENVQMHRLGFANNLKGAFVRGQV